MILLTGSTGFIGGHLYKFLSSKYDLVCSTSKYGGNEDIKNLIYGVDLKDPLHVQYLFKNYDIDTVVHFAADPSTQHNGHYSKFDNNVRSTFNLLQECKEGTRFIFASSVLVYGDAVNANEASELKPTSVYGASKVACESLINAFKTLKDIRPVSLRLCATLGSNMTHGALKNIIQKVITDNKAIQLLGDAPGSIKPCIHISDVCAAVEFFLKNDYQDVYNLTPDDNISILRIAEIVMEELNMTKSIEWLGEESTWKGDNKFLSFSNAKIEKSGYRIMHPKSTTVVRKAVHENIPS